MDQLQVFSHDEFGSVRTLLIGNEPYFVGKDVTDILGYSNSRDALSRHVAEEDRDAVGIHDAIGREQLTVFINESGLYSLILSSKLPAAKRFKHWITSEVLPAIRKLAGTLLILQIISVFQIMYEPMVLTKGGPDNASLSLMQLMWQYAFGGSMNYGKASAVAVIVTLILLVMTAIYSYFNRKESDWD